MTSLDWHIFHNNGHEFVYFLFLTFESKPKSNRMSVVLCCVVLMTMVFSIRQGTKNWGYQSKHFHWGYLHIWGYLKYLGVPSYQLRTMSYQDISRIDEVMIKYVRAARTYF